MILINKHNKNFILLLKKILSYLQLRDITVANILHISRENSVELVSILLLAIIRFIF